MFRASGFLLVAVSAAAVLSDEPIADLTSHAFFSEHVLGRKNAPWAVLFVDPQSPTGAGEDDRLALPAFWRAAAKKAEDVVRLGIVDCSALGRFNTGRERGFAESYCAEAKNRRLNPEPGKEKDRGPREFGFSIQGYTFKSKGAGIGDIKMSPASFSWSWRSVAEPSLTPLSKWLTGPEVLPNLAVGLTAAAGTNIFQKVELGKFLKYKAGIVHKALFFTTSPKGEPPVMLKSLALRYGQRLLVAEIKASDQALRKAFGVHDPPAIVVVKPGSKDREKFVGEFKRTKIERFLDGFVGEAERIPNLHSALKDGKVETQHVKVKRQTSGGRKRKEL